MKVKRADVIYEFGCSCWESPSKRRTGEVFQSGEEDLYKCNKCGKEDYFDAFNDIVLKDNFIHCQHCNKNTQQKLVSFDEWIGIVKSKCFSCKNIIKTDLTKEYCDVCKCYHSFNREPKKDRYEGDYGYEVYKCTNCKNGSFEKIIYVGEYF